MCLMRVIDRIFDDKRLAVTVLMAHDRIDGGNGSDDDNDAARLTSGARTRVDLLSAMHSALTNDAAASSPSAAASAWTDAVWADAATATPAARHLRVE
jgi:hypothetical protein